MTEMNEAFGNSLMNELLEEAAEQAAQSGTRTNMGRLTFAFRYIHWVNRTPVEVDAETYRSLGRREKSIEITFKVDIQELNPTLDFNYERRVMLHSKDWFEHWQRSVIEYYDLEVEDDSLSSRERQAELNKRVIAKTQALAGQYVMIADEEQSKQKDPDKVYRTPALMEVYESRQACFDAYEERFGQAPGGVAAPQPATSSQEPPEGYDSYDEFAQAVRMMRDAGRSNKEVADALGVSVGEVALVS